MFQHRINFGGNHFRWKQIDESQRIDVDYLVESSGGQRTSGPSYGGTGAGCVEAYQSVVASYAIAYYYVSPWQSSSSVCTDVWRNVHAGKKRTTRTTEDRRIDTSTSLLRSKWGSEALRNFFFARATRG